MLQKLRNNPLLTASFVVLLYALWFIVPSFFIEIDPKQNGVSGIDGAIGQWVNELVIGTVLIVIITLMGWWKEIGFRSINPGGLKFLIAPMILILIILGAAWQIDEGSSWFLGFSSPLQLLALFTVILMLGFVEESIFRGILFHGLETKFTPLLTVSISAVIFGLFHYVNLLMGAGEIGVHYQVIHAAAAGFLYASLRLRIGAIWPVMIFHGLWDSSLFILQTAQHSKDKVEGLTSFSPLLAILFALPALSYGLFVYWRWSVWSHKSIAMHG